MDVKLAKRLQWSTDEAIDRSIEKHKKAIQRLMALKVGNRLKAEALGLMGDGSRKT